jgi:hypothetical protein
VAAMHESSPTIVSAAIGCPAPLCRWGGARVLTPHSLLLPSVLLHSLGSLHRAAARAAHYGRLTKFAAAVFPPLRAPSCPTTCTTTISFANPSQSPTAGRPSVAVVRRHRSRLCHRLLCSGSGRHRQALAELSPSV